MKRKWRNKSRNKSDKSIRSLSAELDRLDAEIEATIEAVRLGMPSLIAHYVENVRLRNELQRTWIVERTKFKVLFDAESDQIAEISRDLPYPVASSLKEVFRRTAKDQKLLTHVYNFRADIMREGAGALNETIAQWPSDSQQPMVSRFFQEHASSDIGSAFARLFGVKPSVGVMTRITRQLKQTLDKISDAKRTVAIALCQAIWDGRLLCWDSWYADFGNDLPYLPWNYTVPNNLRFTVAFSEKPDRNGIQNENSCGLEACINRIRRDKTYIICRQRLEEELHDAKAKEERVRRRYGADETTIAAAAAHYGNTRSLAERVKPALRRQLRLLAHCPYCEGPIGSDARADHIYPVVKGGLSTQENMIYVCLACNQKKSDLTLREFIAIMSFDRHRIESTLDKLGKLF